MMDAHEHIQEQAEKIAEATATRTVVREERDAKSRPTIAEMDAWLAAMENAVAKSECAFSEVRSIALTSIGCAREIAAHEAQHQSDKSTLEEKLSERGGAMRSLLNWIIDMGSESGLQYLPSFGDVHLDSLARGAVQSVVAKTTGSKLLEARLAEAQQAHQTLARIMGGG